MSRLQSLVDRRDESYSTATNLMTSISDTRSNLMGDKRKQRSNGKVFAKLLHE